ncbi:MAG TPA: GNAT family protein [Patescibacteria group bacterium]|nr:GNAT family protein [Patescibacteria group bacterium]
MLSGPTVSIGPLVPDDFLPIFHWSNDVEASRLNASYRPVDWVSHRAWCDSVGQDPSRVVFAIRRHNDPKIVGYVEIIHINPTHRSAQLGIRIGAAADRGQGLGKEALRIALHYSWNHLNLNRVSLTTLRHNERAIRAFTAAGFRREGTLRRAEFIDGAWVDLVMMAALRPSRHAEPFPVQTATVEVRRKGRLGAFQRNTK